MITHNKNNDFTGFLGNRMFQTAATIGIANKHGLDNIVKFSESEYLSSFKNLSCVSNDIIRQLNYVDIHEQSFGYQDVVLSDVNSNYNIIGYRQTEKYFDHCKDLIKKSFEFKDEIKDICQIIIDNLRKEYFKKLISVHIRCGDYLKLKEHHTCLMDMTYYSNALQEFNFDESVFIIFSDEPKIASEYFGKIHSGKIKYKVLDKMSAANGMCLMSMMDSHIIANSSYSWWASWLSGKKTVAPSKNKWFGPAYNDMEVNDIIPESWKQIE